jgi:hypothetical protein
MAKNKKINVLLYRLIIGIGALGRAMLFGPVGAFFGTIGGMAIAEEMMG